MFLNFNSSKYYFSVHHTAEANTDVFTGGSSSEEKLTETELFTKYYTEWKDQSQNSDSTFNTIPKFYYKVKHDHLNRELTKMILSSISLHAKWSNGVSSDKLLYLPYLTNSILPNLHSR